MGDFLARSALLAWNTLLKSGRIFYHEEIITHGDHSACPKPPVDIDLRCPYTKTQRSNQCQREVLNKLNGHPVQ